MSELEWKEFRPRHWEADTDTAHLHIYQDSHASFWSVHLGSLFIQDRTPMPFEVARDDAEEALDCWERGRQSAAVTAERDTYLETVRATFRVLESRGQAPDDNAPLSVTVRRVLNALDRVTAERDALKKRVADAEKIYTPDGGRAALVRLEDGEK